MTKRRRQRRVYLNLCLLVLLLVNLSALYVVLKRIEHSGERHIVQLLTEEPKPETPLFQSGQSVQLLEEAQVSVFGESLADLKSLIGQVVSVDTSRSNPEKRIVYKVRYGADWEVDGLFEEDLRPVEPPYDLGQEVALVEHVQSGQFEDGLVTGIRLEVKDGKPHYIYTASFPDLGQVTDLVETDFVTRVTLALREENSPTANDELLRQALNQARQNPVTRIDFPTGRFAIGSQTPEKDYQLLTSNLDLRGHDTTLVVHGSARWFGLATGPGPTDGLSNFSMSGLTIEAQDLVKGNQFILMANHGNNWQVTNNRFILVHQLSSHVFDLGGVQNAVFSDNVFEGYAPELTHVSVAGDRTAHNFISEAIQFDTSSNNGIWDGGLIQALDPNYQKHNPSSLVSANITVHSNYFLPYLNQDGELIAYGATIGQHSFGVGEVTITDNVFSTTLATRFVNQFDPLEAWFFDPIHFQTDQEMTIYGNYFE